MTPETVMIFAAGRGARLGSLTETVPKPLISVSGQTMLDRALALVDAAGISRKVVNTCYLGHLIAEHLSGRQDITILCENGNALETGGGLKNARPFLGAAPVFTLNPDGIWTGGNPLLQLRDLWRPEKMGALLTLVPLEKVPEQHGAGDFQMDESGRIRRFHGGAGPVFIYTGAQIISPEITSCVPDDRFSLNILWDLLIAKGRLFGCVHPGGWADMGTFEGLSRAKTLLREGKNV